VTHQPRASFQSPRFAQPATFMRLPHVEDPRGLDVAIVGVPYDGGTSYRPGARLSEFIHFRDKTCRWPGCNRTRVEIDHTIRREDGGLTVQRNLGDFCKAHHQLKDAPGWKVVQDDNAIFTFITPHGRVYKTYPPGADGEVKPVETINIPKPAGRKSPPDQQTPPQSDELPPF